jgi:hypothetical protein
MMHGLADKDTYTRTFFARSIPHGVMFTESVIDVAHCAYTYCISSFDPSYIP